MLALVLLMTLLPPVDGRVVQAFAGGDDPFAPGLRRAVVLSAVAGEAVRAPCPGVVRFAGATPRGAAVTLGCGRRRVTMMPVRAGVVRGARVGRGARLGVAAGNLSVSVRAPDGSYLAPRFARRRLLPPLGASPPRWVAPRPAAPPRAAPVRLVAPTPTPTPAPVPALPWPAWAGAALVLAAAVRRARCVRGRARALILRRSLSRQ